MLPEAISLAQFLARDLLHPLTGASSALHGGYLFWSGIAGIGLIGSGIWTNTLHRIRRHNCHTHRCPRIGRFPVAGGRYVVCKRCHKHVTGIPRLTHEHIRLVHRATNTRREDGSTLGVTTQGGGW